MPAFVSARPSPAMSSSPRFPSLRTLIAARALTYFISAAIPMWLVSAANREVAALICLTAGALQPLLMPLWRAVNYHVAHGIFDAAVVLAISVAVPGLAPAALIALVAASTLLATSVRAEIHLLILAVLIVGLLVIGARTGPFDWLSTTIASVAVLAVAARGSTRYRQSLQRTEAHLAEAMSAARAIVHTIDIETQEILEVAGDVRGVTGWTKEQWLEFTPEQVLLPDDLADLQVALARLEQSPEIDYIARIADPDGERRYLRYTGRVETDPRGRQIVRGMLADVTAIHKIADELYEQARRDRTTGLPNRQRLEEHLDRHAVDAEPFVLLIADIRQFKAINDTLGHHIGDLILSMTGSRLSQLAGEQQTVYRLSSDQFAVVLTGTNDPEQALALGQQVAQQCRRPHHVGRVALAAPVSVGGAVSATNVAPSVTLRQADVALNAAKQAGTQVELYHADMQRFTLENLVLSAAVEQGLDRGEFTLHFQPQIDLLSGRVVGAEGLVRWDHPERGLLAPQDFLETIRLSASFERFTLGAVRRTVDAAAAAVDVAHSITFGVNLELRSLLAPGFTDAMLQLLRERSIGHHRVVIEVTETDLADAVVAQSPLDLFVELERLRAGGYRIAIDDFGTGSSSLFRLDTMPADELKIDKAFVQVLGTSARSEMLLTSIIQLGRNLGLRVVAEGVERPEQAAFLATAGCTVGQGWLFSKALPLDELLAVAATTFPVPAPATPATVTHLRSRRG